MFGTWPLVGVPVLFAFLAIPLRLASRRDGDSSPKKNDAYVAQPLLLAALSASYVYSLKAVMFGSKMDAVSCLFFSAGCIIVLFLMSPVDRYLAWDKKNGDYERKLGVGLLLPNLVSVALFSGVLWNANYRRL